MNMWFLLFVMAAIMVSVLIVVIPLMYSRIVQPDSDKDFSVITDNIHELEVDLAHGLLSKGHYDQARHELHRSALELSDTGKTPKACSDQVGLGLPLVVSIVIPLAAIALYAWTGQPVVLLNTSRDISGVVVVDDALVSDVSSSSTLFIYARVPGGPPMPLAAVRKRAAGWPVHFTLDDQDAMIDGKTLSEFDHVDLVARVSRTGSATQQPGDVEGRIERVEMGAQNIKLVLDRRVGVD